MPLYTPPVSGLKKVVIDAGHGGKDPGCFGASSKEKDIALTLALKLGRFIEQNFSDVEVIYTRKTDVFLELYERADIANNHNADLFICIHANSGSASAHGSETYVMGLHRSQSNLQVAKRENASILLEDDYEDQYEGFDPNSDEAYIALSLMQSTYLEQSLRFADKVQKQFEKMGRRNRGVKQAGFLVLYRTTMPSVLIEAGFLTNKEEERFLKSEKNQDAVAQAVFEAFKSYKHEVDSKGMAINESAERSNDQALEIPDAELLYSVQIAASANRVAVKPENFKGIPGVIEYESKDGFKYLIGREPSFEMAAKLQNELKSKGFRGAFIVAFHKGERIDIKDALEIQQKEAN